MDAQYSPRTRGGAAAEASSLGLCVQVHARGKKIEGDVDWELIARGCAGWTGADIAVSCPAAPLNAQGAE